MDGWGENETRITRIIELMTKTMKNTSITSTTTTTTNDDNIILIEKYGNIINILK